MSKFPSHARSFRSDPLPKGEGSIAAVLVVFALSACAPTTVWVKEGADAQALRRDQAECNDEGQDYKFIDDRSERSRQRSIGADLYRRCMEGRGWRRQRGGAQ